MSSPTTCCGTEPRATYDTKMKKWFLTCPYCGARTMGHSSKKKAIMAWDKSHAKV